MSEYRKIFLVAPVILLLASVSCRGKKSVATTGDDPAPSKGPGETVELRFGYYFVNGCTERMKGNLQEALKNFSECEKIRANDPALQYELGMISKLQGNPSEAAKHAKICVEAEPRNEWYHLLLIDSYLSSRQYNSAIKARENLIRYFPARSDFKEDLAIEYAMAGHYDKSLKIYDELEKTYGINEQLTLNKVKLLKSQKKSRDAEQELLKLIASDTNEIRYISYLADFYFDSRNSEKAIETYKRVLSKDPEDPEAHLALFDHYNSAGKNEIARKHINRAFMNPDLDLGIKINIVGSFYRNAEDGSEADLDLGMELTRNIMKVHPAAPEPNAMFADFLMLKKEVQEASGYYYTASLKETRNYKIWQNLLYVNSELGRYDSLQKYSARAIELFPAQPECYLYNGVSNMQLGEYRKALTSLKDGLGFVTESKQKVDFLRILGDAHHQLSEYAESDKSFDEVLKMEPDNTYVLNNYAYYLSLRGADLEKAEKLSRRANDLKPGDRSYMDTYGWVLYKMKRYGEAVQWLAKAAAAGPKNPTILEHYGDALFRMNRIEEALVQWKAAKEAGGPDSLSDKILKKKNPDD